jgi:hypothetical protein
MTTQWVSRLGALLATCLVCALPSHGRAEPLAGSFAIELGAANSLLGPGEESIDECEPEGCMTGVLRGDQRGKVTGSLAFTFDFDSDGTHVTGSMAGDFRGRLTGRNGKSRVKVASRVAGALSAAGYPDLPVRGVFSFLEDFDGPLQTVTTSSVFTICARFSGCDREVSPPVAEPMVPDDGGPWTLSLTVATSDQGVITGSAIATFTDGSDPITFDVTGRYSAKPDESSLKLASVLPGPGATARLTHVRWSSPDATFSAYRLTYQICGQSGLLVVP